VDASVRDSVRDSVAASVDASEAASVRDSVRDSVSDLVRDSVRDSVSASVHASVAASVDASVAASVRDSVDASASTASRRQQNDYVRNAQYRYLGGQFWVGWGYGYRFRGNAAVGFVIDVLKLDIGREQGLKARAYAATAMSACWWWPHTDFIVVSERPSLIDKSAGIARWEWTDANGRSCEWSVDL
jgi:hypothetical protein